MGMRTFHLTTVCPSNGTRWESGPLAVPDDGVRVKAERPLCGHDDCELVRIVAAEGEWEIVWDGMNATIGSFA